jgi:hypothetical protein
MQSKMRFPRGRYGAHNFMRNFDDVLGAANYPGAGDINDDAAAG